MSTPITVLLADDHATDTGAGARRAGAHRGLPRLRGGRRRRGSGRRGQAGTARRLPARHQHAGERHLPPPRRSPARSRTPRSSCSPCRARTRTSSTRCGPVRPATCSRAWTKPPSATRCNACWPARPCFPGPWWPAWSTSSATVSTGGSPSPTGQAARLTGPRVGRARAHAQGRRHGRNLRAALRLADHGAEPRVVHSAQAGRADPGGRHPAARRRRRHPSGASGRHRTTPLNRPAASTPRRSALEKAVPGGPPCPRGRLWSRS